MSDRDEIWQAVLDMYQGFLTGDRTRIDGHIADDATVWDSEEPDLAIGKAALDEIRARRPQDDSAPKVADIQASSPVIDVWGDTAVCRHLLTVTFVDGAAPTQHVRNTGVWRRVDGRWLVFHNHEDVLAD
jgi:ketosteroid isomerase-like protein